MALVVFGKELRELARDRRTLVLLFLVPVLLYPGLLIVSEQVALVGMRSIEAEQVILGVDPTAPEEFLALARGDTALRIRALSGPEAEVAVRDDSVAVAIVFGVPELPGTTRPVTVLHDPTDDTSRRGRLLALELVNRWIDSVVRARSLEAGLPSDFARPAEVRESSVALPGAVGGWALGRILPVLLVVVTLLGTFHAAVDAGAGERERGTLETLLTAPVDRSHLVFGKFAAVAAVGIAAAALNLASFLITFRTGLIRLGGGLDLELALGVGGALTIFGALLPLALMFAALFLGISVRARSFREAQHALTPVYLIAFTPALLPLFSGIRLTPALALLPVGGLSLLLRDTVVGAAEPLTAVLAVGSVLAVTWLALRFAVASFGREDVVFAVGDRSTGGGARTSGLTPGAADVVATGPRGTVPPLALAFGFVLFLGLVYFLLGVRLQRGLGESGLLISEWLLLGLPAVAFALGSRFDPRALGLARPSPRQLLASVLIAFGGLTTAWLLAWAQSFVLPIPEAFLEATSGLLEVDGLPRLLWLLLLIAVTPALCEEIVFRGVLLGASRGRLGTRDAVVLNAVVFGAFHLSFETVFRFLPTAWLGLLLAITVWKTGSIWLGVLIHFLNNGSIVVMGAVPTLRSLAEDPQSLPPALWIVLGIAALAMGLRLLSRPRTPAQEGGGADPASINLGPR